MTDRQDTAVRAPSPPRAPAPAGPAPDGPPAGQPPTSATGTQQAKSVKPAKAPKQPKAPKPPRAAKTAKASSTAPGRPRRRARLRLTRIDPWSVMKTSFLLAIAFAVVTVVSVFIIWSVLAAAGVWDSVNQSVQDVVGGQDAAGWDVEQYVGLSRVMGFTILVSVVDIVLITAIATLGAFLYNMSAALVGGIEMTLAEDEH